MRWADVPVDIRERVREHLGHLLQQATTPPGPDEGSANE
jgi:hypothetical protein